MAGAILAMAPVAASAVTVVTDGPINGGIIGLSVGDIFTMEVDGDAVDGGGSVAFGFTATEDLGTIETNSLNKVTGFAGATVEWNSAMDGSGTTFASLTNAEVIAGTAMNVNFLSGDTKWLIATWTDVTGDKENFDLRLEATPIPVPAGAALLLTALGGLGLARRNRKA